MPPASQAPARFLLRLDIQASITECHRPDMRGILIADSEWLMLGLAAGSASRRSFVRVFPGVILLCVFAIGFCPRSVAAACTRSWPTMGHVLAWAVEHDLDTAARLVTALSMWWVLRGRLAGQEPLLRELAEGAEPGSDGWCAAQFWLAWAGLDAADLPQALQRCAAVVDVIGDREPSRILADCLHLQSTILSNLGRAPEAAAAGRRALALVWLASWTTRSARRAPRRA